MSNIKESELFISIEKRIKDEIEKCEKRINDNKERLNNPANGKTGLIDKLSRNSAIKSYQDTLTKLRQLEKQLFLFRHGEANAFNISDELKERLTSIASQIDSKDASVLKDTINECLRKCNKDKKDKVEQQTSEIQKLSKSIGMEKSSVIILDNNGRHKKDENLKKFSDIIEMIYDMKIAALTPKYSNIQQVSQNKSDGLDYENGHIIKEVEKMIQNKELEENDKTRYVIKNISEIKKTYSKKINLESINLEITNTITDLERITEVDFSKVVNFLQKLQKENERVVTECDKYLKNVNFEYLKEQIRINNAKKDKERREKAAEQQYQALAYELEKAKSENPDDYELITELESKMKSVASNSGLSASTLQLAATHGKTKYHEDKRTKEIVADSIKEKLAEQDKIIAEAQAGLRNMAIRELELAGAFEDSYEVVNGDVRNTITADKKEAMIRAKMEEMARTSQMKAEERGLRDQQAKGRISSDKSLSDLTPQQLRDLEYAYRDGSSGYEYVQEYREKVESINAQMRQQATTIYKEYIKYLAKEQDKSAAMKFSDYARMQYGYENMDISMVEEEVKGVSR